MKLFYLAFLIGMNIAFANPYKFEKEVDIVAIAKAQSDLSETILENYFQQEYLDNTSKQLNNDIIQFEENLNILLQYSETNNGTLKSSINNNNEVWKSFKEIVSQPFDESNITKIIEISTKLFLSSEAFSLESQKIYHDNLEGVGKPC